MPYNSWGDDGINSRQLQLLITFSTIQPSSLSLLLMFLLSIHWFGRILYSWSREDGSLTPNFIPFVIGHLNFQLFKNLSLYRAAAKRWECAEPRYHYNCHPTKGENLSLSLSLTHLPPLDFSNIAPTHKLFGSTLKCGVVNGPSPQALKLKLFFPTRFSLAWLKPWPCRSSLFLFPVPKKTRILTERWILPTSFSFMNHGALERNFCSQIPHNLIAYVGGHFYTIPTWWFLY